MFALYISGISPDFLSYPIQFIIQFLLGTTFLVMLGNFHKRTFAGFVWGLGGLLALILEHNVALRNPDYKLVWTLVLDGGFATALFFRWISFFDLSKRRHIFSRSAQHALFWLLATVSLLIFLNNNQVFLNWFRLGHIIFATFVLAMISTMLVAMITKPFERFWNVAMMSSNKKR